MDVSMATATKLLVVVETADVSSCCLALVLSRPILMVAICMPSHAMIILLVTASSSQKFYLGCRSLKLDGMDVSTGTAMLLLVVAVEATNVSHGCCLATTLSRPILMVAIHVP